ncbi:large ribosomal subunit protein mL54 [Phymastichus coffea]|uniref:large ribosomal subunit protein mL54 n=1 Tax=Phymastichus coffea TaxID=108790 RepID=UPI00273B3B10|nr:large ribosomal subunit protein mL54 [Phymastichus coffea]
MKMILFVVSNLSRLTKNLLPLQYYIQSKNYALPGIGVAKGKKITKGKGPIAEKKVLPVEQDTYKLVKYCCGTNILKEGGQDVELKPDSEYPDWLWTIRTGPPPPLEELDPNTKEYWRRLRRLGIKRDNKLKSLKKW